MHWITKIAIRLGAWSALQKELARRKARRVNIAWKKEIDSYIPPAKD